MLSRNITVGVEYNYIDLASKRSVTPTSAAAGTVDLDQTVDAQIQTVKPDNRSAAGGMSAQRTIHCLIVKM
jgi:hypothetical protein